MRLYSSYTPTHVLTEKRPADRYVTADSVEFTVEDTGKIQNVGMKDDTTKIRLIKLAGDTGQGLRGAKFEVYDSKGKKVMNFTSKEDGYDITGKLAVGETYTFKEVEAPKGYQLAKSVKYKIKKGRSADEISSRGYGNITAYGRGGSRFQSGSRRIVE